jgi:hypothetical protein
VRQQCLYVRPKYPAQYLRGHGFGLDGALNVQGASVFFLPWFCGQAVVVNLLGCDANAPEGHADIAPKVSAKLLFNLDVD